MTCVSALSLRGLCAHLWHLWAASPGVQLCQGHCDCAVSQAWSHLEHLPGRACLPRPPPGIWCFVRRWDWEDQESPAGVRQLLGAWEATPLTDGGERQAPGVHTEPRSFSC